MPAAPRSGPGEPGEEGGKPLEGPGGVKNRRAGRSSPSARREQGRGAQRCGFAKAEEFSVIAKRRNNLEFKARTTLTSRFFK